MRYYALAEHGEGIDLSPYGVDRVFITSDKPITLGVPFGAGERLNLHRLTTAERGAWEGETGVALSPGATLLDALWRTVTHSGSSVSMLFDGDSVEVTHE